MIIQNIQYAFAHHNQIVLHIPVIPGFNDPLTAAKHFAQLFNEHRITEVQLLSFHQFGENKYQLLGRKYEFELFELPATDWLAISFKWSTTTYLEHYQKLLAAYQKEFKMLTDQIDVYEISVPTTYSVTGNSEFITELKIPSIIVSVYMI